MRLLPPHLPGHEEVEQDENKQQREGGIGEVLAHGRRREEGEDALSCWERNARTYAFRSRGGARICCRALASSSMPGSGGRRASCSQHADVCTVSLHSALPRARTRHVELIHDVVHASQPPRPPLRQQRPGQPVLLLLLPIALEQHAQREDCMQAVLRGRQPVGQQVQAAQCLACINHSTRSAPPAQHRQLPPRRRISRRGVAAREPQEQRALPLAGQVGC